MEHQSDAASREKLTDAMREDLGEPSSEGELQPPGSPPRISSN